MTCFDSVSRHLIIIDSLFFIPLSPAITAVAAASAIPAMRPVRGGCLAVAYGRGLNPLRDKDPGCFMTPPAEMGGRSCQLLMRIMVNSFQWTIKKPRSLWPGQV